MKKIFSHEGYHIVKSKRGRAPRLLSFSLYALLAVSLILGPGTAYAKKSHRVNQKYAAIVMDADTGMILDQQFADKPLHPASLTKMMTLLLMFDALDHGKATLNTRMPVSQFASTMAPSKLDLKPGDTIRVEDAILALVTKSANDVAVVMAEYLGGSERNFARIMTRKAKEIGMNRTRFVNASGLNNPAQISTARDMAKLARSLIKDHSKYYHYFSVRNFSYQGANYHTHNHLMDHYDGMDGLKTGYVAASGFNLVASAVRNHRRIIGVVFGGHSAYSRNTQMAKLLDRGFAKISDLRVAANKVPIPQHKPAILLAMNALNNAKNAAGSAFGEDQDEDQGGKWAFLGSDLHSNVFSKLIGEGDFDPEARRRIEAGLMAMAAHTGRDMRSKYIHTALMVNPALKTMHLKSQALNRDLREQQEQIADKESSDQVNAPDNRWAVQVGAFSSRVQTDQVVSRTLAALPANLSHANAVIAPLKTDEGWIFRGRLAGLSQEEAESACDYINDCLTIPPYGP